MFAEIKRIFFKPAMVLGIKTELVKKMEQSKIGILPSQLASPLVLPKTYKAAQSECICAKTIDSARRIGHYVFNYFGQLAVALPPPENGYKYLCILEGAGQLS